MARELLFSVTADDCDWSYTKGTGSGGQKKNKTSSAVHCIHKASGAHAFSQDGRSQLHNRQDAFRKMAETKEFQNWHKIECAKRSKNYVDIDKVIDEQMKHIKLEVKVKGQWKEVTDLKEEINDSQINPRS